MDGRSLAFAFFLLGYFLFNERPHTFRSLVCTSLTLFCSDTLLAGYRSLVRYLLFYVSLSDLPSVAFSALWSILFLFSFLCRSNANHIYKPPSFPCLSAASRRSFCRPLTAIMISSLDFLSDCFMKDINIFC